MSFIDTIPEEHKNYFKHMVINLPKDLSFVNKTEKCPFKFKVMKYQNGEKKTKNFTKYGKGDKPILCLAYDLDKQSWASFQEDHSRKDSPDSKPVEFQDLLKCELIQPVEKDDKLVNKNHFMFHCDYKIEENVKSITTCSLVNLSSSQEIEFENIDSFLKYLDNLAQKTESSYEHQKSKIPLSKKTKQYMRSVFENKVQQIWCLDDSVLHILFYKLKVKDFLMTKGKILRITTGNNFIKFRNYSLICRDLKKLTTEFGRPNCSVDDLAQTMKEFNKSLYDMTGMNPYNRYSVARLTYDSSTSTLHDKKVYIVKDVDFYNANQEALKKSQRNLLLTDEMVLEGMFRYIDINALHPYTMSKYRFPVGKPSKATKTCQIKEALNNLEYDNLGIFKVTIEYERVSNFPVIAWRDGKDPYERRSQVWVDSVLLKDAIRYNNAKILKIWDGYEWLNQDFLFEKIKELYNKRRELKEKGNICQAQAIKDFLNFLYGSLSRWVPEKKYELVSTVERFEAILEEKEDVSFARKGEDRIVYYKNEVTEYDIDRPCFLSVFISSYANHCVNKAVDAIDGFNNKQNTPVYHDTDSLVLKEDCFEKLKELGFIDQTKLGKFKDEMLEVVNKCTFIKRKCYLLESDNKIEYKVAGLTIQPGDDVREIFQQAVEQKFSTNVEKTFNPDILKEGDEDVKVLNTPFSI